MQSVWKKNQRLREVNVKLSPKNCTFFKKKVKYVGNIASEDGIVPDPDKINKVHSWPKSRNSNKVRHFLGFFGYCRRFIEGFLTIARPLYQLILRKEKREFKQMTNGNGETNKNDQSEH